MLEIDILRNYVPKGLDDFWGIGCPKDTHVPSWVRLCLVSFSTTIVQNNNTRLHYTEPADLLRPALIVHYGRLKQ